jgi:hypothetical protein
MGFFGNSNSKYFSKGGPAESKHDALRNVQADDRARDETRYQSDSLLYRLGKNVNQAAHDSARKEASGNTDDDAFTAASRAGLFKVYKDGGGHELFGLASEGEENLRATGYTLAWQHVPTGREVEFKAFLEQISDAFTTNWQTESVYGRMDEIATYQNTVRSIAVLWHIPAASLHEAIINMQNVQHLMQFLYPVYDNDGIIAAPPLMRLRFGNMIRNAHDGGGLLGHVNGFTVDPDPEAGWFALPEGPMTGAPELYPKAIRLNCDFTVLHEHDLGYKKTKNGYMFRGGKHDEAKPTGIDFPWPAGAGNPEISGQPKTPNSHLAEGVKPTDEDKIKNRKHFRSVTHANQQVNIQRVLEDGSTQNFETK